MARFGGSALEAAKNSLKDNKVTDHFVKNTAYCCITKTLKFQMGVLGNQQCVNSNNGHKSFAMQYQRSEFWYQQEVEASNRAQVLWKNAVVVNDTAVLLAMLRVPRTIWWQTTFVVKDVAMMHRI